jgi:predicted kinase
MKPRLIILRGCMGSGKSTIAHLYRNFEQQFAYLKVDNFKDLFDHFEKPARPVVHGAVLATLDYLLAQGYSVVMEGVLQDTATIDQAIVVAQKHHTPCKVFELETGLATLQARDRQREEVRQGIRQPLGEEAIEHIFNKLKKHPYLSAITLDTERLSPQQAVKFINDQFEK